MASQPDPSGIEIAPGVTVAPDGLRIQFSRSSGPGGQNVNKLSTRAQLWIRIDAITGLTDRARQRLRQQAGSRLTQNDELHLSADEYRSQESNRQAVMDRLRQMILAARREPRVRRKTRPTRAAREKRLTAKKQRGQIKSLRKPVT